MSAAVSEAARAQALALAAMLECATLVDELARTGEARAHGVRTLANGLLRFEWQRVEDVWGGGGALGGALQRLESALMLSAGDAQAPALRYALALAHLGKRLARDRERLALIRGRLQALAADAQQFTQDFDTVAPALAALYEETISRYSFRIKVTGSPGTCATRAWSRGSARCCSRACARRCCGVSSAATCRGCCSGARA